MVGVELPAAEANAGPVDAAPLTATPAAPEAGADDEAPLVDEVPEVPPVPDSLLLQPIAATNSAAIHHPLRIFMALILSNTH